MTKYEIDIENAADFAKKYERVCMNRNEIKKEKKVISRAESVITDCEYAIKAARKRQDAAAEQLAEAEAELSQYIKRE